MPLKTLKKAHKFALQGDIESALPILLKDFEIGEAPAAAALAQIAAFQGRWQDVITYAELALRKHSELATLNIYNESTNLLALAGLYTGEWEKIESLVEPLLEQAIKEADPDSDYNPQKHMTNELLKFIKSRGQADYAWTLCDYEKDSLEERISKFKNAVKTLPQRKADVFENNDERIQEIYALAKVYCYHQGAVDFYDQEGLQSDKESAIDFDQILFIASGLCRVKRTEEAWKLIHSYVYTFWPVDYAQMQPVELFFDPHLRPLLTPDRCEEILRTPKGDEAEKLTQNQEVENNEGSEDEEEGEYSTTTPVKFLGAEEMEVLCSSSQDQMGKKQKKTMEEFLKKQQELAPQILEKIFEWYKDNYSSYKDGWMSGGEMSEEELEEFLPAPNSAQNLLSHLTPAVLHLPSEKNFAEDTFGIEFDCDWDEEHGLGVLVKNGKVLEVGHAQVAYFLD